MAQKYNVIVEKDEDGWFVSEVVGLLGCHTQAKTVEQLMERTKEAIKAYLESEGKPMLDTFVGLKQVEV